MVFLKEVQKVCELIITETVVAEVHHTLHRSRLRMLDHPPQILQLQVSDSHMFHHAFFLQLVEGRECLVDHLLQSSLQSSLKLDIVYVDDVDIVDMESFQTLVHTLLGTTCGVVPGVVTVFPIASHLCREEEFVSGDVLECLSQHNLRLIIAVVGRYIDDIDTSIDGSEYRVDTSVFVEGMEDAT